MDSLRKTTIVTISIFLKPYFQYFINIVWNVDFFLRENIALNNIVLLLINTKDRNDRFYKNNLYIRYLAI